MAHPEVVFPYVVLMLVQTLHIFEEIAMEAYAAVGSLNKYLLAASAIVTVNFAILFLLLLDSPIGYVLALAGAVMGIGNGVVHVAGYIKARSFRGTLGAGVFTSIPLGAIGVLVLIQLLGILT